MCVLGGPQTGETEAFAYISQVLLVFVVSAERQFPEIGASGQRGEDQFSWFVVRVDGDLQFIVTELRNFVVWLGPF